ncbi:MAG: hypothetical protein MJZ07_01625 [Bacteroidales bacterium]|nr:hypothetical protein [Bacteroidales bacterium]
MKRFLTIFALALACVVTSCTGDITKVKQMHLTSYKIVSISPVGLRGVDIAVDLGIDNPAIQFNVSDINVELFRLGKSLGTFVNSEDILVKGNTVGTYRLSGRVALSEGVSVLSVLGLATKFDMDEFTISYSAKVTLKSGLHTTLSEKNVPLRELLEDDTKDDKKKK